MADGALLASAELLGVPALKPVRAKASHQPIWYRSVRSSTPILHSHRTDIGRQSSDASCKVIHLLVSKLAIQVAASMHLWVHLLIQGLKAE